MARAVTPQTSNGPGRTRRPLIDCEIPGTTSGFLRRPEAFGPVMLFRYDIRALPSSARTLSTRYDVGMSFRPATLRELHSSEQESLNLRFRFVTNVASVVRGTEVRKHDLLTDHWLQP